MRTLALALTCVASLVALPVQAQSPNSSAIGSPLWEVHLHLQKSFASPLGQRAMEVFEKENPGKLEDLAKFVEAIGLDPRTDIGEVVLFGDGFEETDATVVANIGQCTGNLEGWVLTAPGYQSEDLNESTQLHSILVEDKNARAWFALPKHTSSNSFILVGSLDRQRTADLAEQVLAGNASPVPNPVQGNTIFAFAVNDLSAVPMKIDDKDPGSAILKIIEQFGLSLASDSENLSVDLAITATDSAKARQISQLLTGLKALMQLAPLEEPEAQKVAQILETLAVSHTEGQANVQASLSAPYELLEKLVKELD